MTIKPRRSIRLDSVPSVNASAGVTAEDPAKALKGRKVGRGWMACCPAHRVVCKSMEAA